MKNFDMMLGVEALAENNTETEKNLMEELRENFALLKKLKGKKGAEQLMNMLINGESEKSIDQTFNQLTEKGEAVSRGLEVFEEEGLVEYGEGGEMICDLDKIRNNVNENLLSKCGPIYNSEYYGNHNSSQTIFLIFKDKKVISKEDYEKGIREAKLLFYSPQNKEDALDVERIKKSDFYLNLGEVIRSSNYESAKYGDVEDLNYKEVVLPLLIYHPKYLDGYRDKSGQLMVRDEDGQYKKISATYLNEKFSYSIGNKPGRISVRSFIRDSLPNLVKAGLLLPEDFLAKRATKKDSYSNREIKKTRSRGQVMYNNILYALGNKYSSEKGYRAVNLSNDLGGIIHEDENGNQKIEAVFDFLNNTEELVMHNKRREQYAASAKKCGVREFKIQDFLPQKDGEGDVEYQERLKETVNLPEFFEISDKLSTEKKLNLVELDFKNQLLVATLYKKVGEKKFMDFFHEYRMDGLKTCLALENENEMKEVILQISEQKEKDPQFSARLVFRKYNQIIQEKGNLQEVVSQMAPNKEFREKDYADMLNNFEKRSQKTLKDFLGRINKLSVDEVESGLEMIQKQMVFLGSILTLFKDRKGEFSLEDIRGLNIQESGEKDLVENPELWEKLKLMYRANNSHKSKEDLERLMRDFEEHKKHKSEFYLVYFDQKGGDDPEKSLDNLVGFMRSSNFDGQKELESGERYLGAMNINPLLQKFYFGENFLREIVEKELANGAKKLIAHVPENGPSHKALKSLGISMIETQEGEYKDNDGNVIAKRIRVELTKE